MTKDERIKRMEAALLALAYLDGRTGQWRTAKHRDSNVTHIVAPALTPPKGEGHD